MASEAVNAKQARNRFTKGKRQQQIKNRSSLGDGDGEDSFLFEANEAWKDFHGSLLQFYENGELCDVTLKVGSKLISCHKLALACVIPYFKAMFLSEMAEAKQTLIEIRDFDGDAIEDLVKFVYSSRLTLTVDNVQPLLYAACILQVELVARACCEYMKLHFHPSNCLAVRAFAESHNRIDLMDMADQYACEHFTEVVECEDFVSVSPQHLHKLLSSSDLNIENEKQVYSAAIKWLLANPQHHPQWLDETLAQVRLPLLPVDFLMGVVAKEQIVKQNLKCRDLLDEARNYHLHLSSRAVPDFEYSIRTTPRKHTAGVLFCVGGRGGSGDPFRSIECYSINKNSWFFGPEMNSRRRHVGVISVEAALDLCHARACFSCSPVAVRRLLIPVYTCGVANACEDGGGKGQRQFCRLELTTSFQTTARGVNSSYRGTNWASKLCQYLTASSSIQDEFGPRTRSSNEK
ncbi:hypothetical protein JEQ12_017587 [Ovis aries]|uniref:BTB domain-containing protein n=1 Tax=Ovis aries TaxID=9940 RepID=A0A836AET2_SHEEP|nr:hypothetical protein JEQ12_017587 [Ovis aries]